MLCAPGKLAEGWEEDRRYPERVLAVQRGVTPACVFHLVTLLQVRVTDCLGRALHAGLRVWLSGTGV